MENPKFTIYRSAGNYEYYYRLRARNGEVILSGEGYLTRESCMNGIKAVKTLAAFDGNYNRKDGTFYSFNLKAVNSEIIGRSEIYMTNYARENGINAVKRDAYSAPIEELY